MSLNIHRLLSHLNIFSDNTGTFSDEHGGVFIRKLQRWRNDIRESGPLPCLLTTVGLSSEMLLISYTIDRQSEVASRSGLSWLSDVYISYIYKKTGVDFLETVANFGFSLSYWCSAPRN